MVVEVLVPVEVELFRKPRGFPTLRDFSAGSAGNHRISTSWDNLFANIHHCLH
jgi:hypothetical protein